MYDTHLYIQTERANLSCVRMQPFSMYDSAHKTMCPNVFNYHAQEAKFDNLWIQNWFTLHL